MGDSILFSSEKMIEAFEAFDPLRFKYNFKETEISKKGGIYPDWKRYFETEKYEKSTQYESLTKRDYAGDYANLHLIYDEDDEKKDLEYIRIVELILDKVIGQYINIDGMERLFSETYIEFEWEMHLSADYKKHNMKYYRDHFVHQIRDAYMMFIFLDELGFYEHIKKILLSEGKSKVSRYVQRSLVQQEYYETPKLQKLHEDDEDFYIRNMIYMASFMAALFHDIGYPEQYYMKTSRHIREYIASLHELNSSAAGVNKLYSLLQNSLLFRVVSFSEIEERISHVGSFKQGPEHGALSAIIFLLHFYENGAIYTLQPYKKAAVEMAALAIYNHTNKYGVITNKDEYAYYRPCFSLNPISYLLRICDDLQEWDRLYFVISKKPSIWFCNSCRTPLIVKNTKENGCSVRTCYCKTSYDRMLQTDDVQTEDVGLTSRGFEGETGFTARRIFNVIVCDKLDVMRKNLGTSGEKLLVRLDYNLYKLLHIAYLNPSYAKYRIGELNSQKLLYEMQEEIPAIYLDYFVSNNPILIKVQILAQYFKRISEYPGLKKDMDDSCGIMVRNELNDTEKEEFRKKLREWRNTAAEAVRGILSKYELQVKNENLFRFRDGKYESVEEEMRMQNLIDYQKMCLDFYSGLYIFQYIHGKKTVKENSEFEKFLIGEELKIADEYREYPELCCLIEDCFLQFSRMYEDIMEYDCYPGPYYKQFENSGRREFFASGKADGKNESIDFYYTAIERYLDMNFAPEMENEYDFVPVHNSCRTASRYDQIREAAGGNYIDAFTDLYLFRLMDEETMKEV